jgi:hypothetical protein
MHCAQLWCVILIFEDFVGCLKFSYPGCIPDEGMIVIDNLFRY